ncbi:MAG: histidinol-phosphate transaminase [Eubacteriales bacterium]
MSQFLANHMKTMKPYTPGHQPKKGEYIKLNTNENPFPPPPEVSEIMSESAKSLHLYSDTNCKLLTDTFAEHYQISPESVIFANGSDEILAFCYMAFCDSDKGMCFPSISYGFYPVYADLFNIDGKKIPLNPDLTISPDHYFNQDHHIVIANPNAPTGIALTLSQIEEILVHNPKNVVIIDEAYVHFGGESAMKLTETYQNLIVCGTFSKSRNLAGGRLGYAVAHPSLLADLNLVKFSFNPYNVNTLTQALGVASIKNDRYFQHCTQSVVKTRRYFIDSFDKLGFHTLPSCANFIFTKHHDRDGAFLFEKLKEHKILVRHFDQEPINQYLRITIGTQEEMAVVVQKMTQILEENHA